MFLGKKELEKRIKIENLLTNCNIENIQGAGVDLSIEKLFETTSAGFLGKRTRNLPELKEVDFVLKPGRYYLCLTREQVNMPLDLIAFIFPRSTLFRCGASLRTAVVDPGYRGALTLGIKNESEFELKLEKGARIAQMVFSKVQGAKGYKGKYQGGKMR